MNRLNIFENKKFGKIRVIEMDGAAWFVGKDVAEALGYEKPRNAISAHVGEEDKLLLDAETQPQIRAEFDYRELGQRGGWLINESGLYSLILSSKLPDAKKFKRWITSEVLPSIRKHGAYLTSDTLEKMISSPDFGIKLLTELKKERDMGKSLKKENEHQAMVIEEYKPKVSYYDLVLQTKDLMSVTQIAKDYGKSAQWLNNYLSGKGVQYKLGGVWIPYQQYAKEGYTRSKTNVYNDELGEPHSKLHTYWTQKGRWFIYKLLERDGILPLIEIESA